jgi:hypothetical protein
MKKKANRGIYRQAYRGHQPTVSRSDLYDRGEVILNDTVKSDKKLKRLKKSLKGLKKQLKKDLKNQAGSNK